MNVYRHEVVEYRVYGDGSATVAGVNKAAHDLESKTGEKARWVVAHPEMVVCLVVEMMYKGMEMLMSGRGGGKMYVGNMEVKEDENLGNTEWYVSTTESVTERSY